MPKTTKLKVIATEVIKPLKPSVASPKKTKEANGESDMPTLAKLREWLNYAKLASQKKHWEYFVVDQFLRGNHNIRGNPEENTIVVTRKTESISYPINKIYSTFRAVRAFVTRHKPKVEVDITDLTDEAKTYARRANKILERDNQLNNGRRLNKEWAYYGIKYGMGLREIGYDKVKKCAIRWSVDPTDLFIGAKTGKLEDAPYLIKSVIRTVGYWNQKFPDKNIVPDNEVAEDEYKKLGIELNYNMTQTSGLSEDEQTAIGYECWYRVFKPNKNKGLVNRVLFTKTEILSFEETPYTEYPFVVYEAEVLPNELYPDGHLKHVIAPQRLLNLLNTQLLEYNHIVNRGRFLKDKNSGFRAIYAKEGQIIEKNAGKRVDVLPPPPLNPALFNQLGLSQEWIEDIGGQHDASLGATPERVTSGRAIETLQLGDSNNISDLRDNFEDALAEEAAWILKVYSLFEEEGFVLEDKLPDGEIDKFGVIGEKARMGTIPEKYFIEDNGSYCDVCAILPDNQVKVSVTSELGETKQARLELLMKLVDMGLPFKTLLEHLEFPNVDTILQRIAEEATAEMMMEKMKQLPQPGALPPPGGAGIPPLEAPVNEETLGELRNIRDQLGQIG